jgi:hypothetical protein
MRTLEAMRGAGHPPAAATYAPLLQVSTLLKPLLNCKDPVETPVEL